VPGDASASLGDWFTTETFADSDSVKGFGPLPTLGRWLLPREPGSFRDLLRISLRHRHEGKHVDERLSLMHRAVPNYQARLPYVDGIIVRRTKRRSAPPPIRRALLLGPFAGSN
jgi:hypothetical protein